MLSDPRALRPLAAVSPCGCSRAASCECGAPEGAARPAPSGAPGGRPLVALASRPVGAKLPGTPGQRAWPVVSFDRTAFGNLPTARGPRVRLPEPLSRPGDAESRATLANEGPGRRSPPDGSDIQGKPREPGGPIDGQVPGPQLAADGGVAGGEGTTAAGSCTPNLYAEYEDPRGDIVIVGDTLLTFANAFQLDAAVLLFMMSNDIPNGTLSVVSPDGRLVHSRGYTNRPAYVRAKEDAFIAGPNSRFRVASVSKSLTALATVLLEQAGVLPDGLQTKVDGYVDLTSVPPLRLTSTPPFFVTYSPAAHLDELKIIHLLTHTGGWFEGTPELETDPATLTGYVAKTCPTVLWTDAGSIANTMASASGPFPTCQYAEITEAFGSTLPVTANQILRWGNTLALSKAPGERYHYSNYGYWLLGRVIEGVTCRGYESFVRDELLLPLGMYDTVMGQTDRARRALREVPYFAELWPWESGSSSLLATQSSPWEVGPIDYEPYAAFDIGNYDAHGGWLSSSFDLALLLAEVFNGRSGVISAASRVLLLYPWECRDWAGNTVGLGFEQSGSSVRKGGQFTGTIARIENRTGNSAGAYSFAYAFNRNWGNLPYVTNNESNMLTTIRNQLAAVTNWGGVDDLFVP